MHVTVAVDIDSQYAFAVDDDLAAFPIVWVFRGAQHAAEPATNEGKPGHRNLLFDKLPASHSTYALIVPLSESALV